MTVKLIFAGFLAFSGAASAHPPLNGDELNVFIELCRQGSTANSVTVIEDAIKDLSFNEKATAMNICVAYYEGQIRGLRESRRTRP